MRIVLTGCLGFIGSNLVPFLLKAGHTVVGIDNRVNAGEDSIERIHLNTPEKYLNKFSYFSRDIIDRDGMLDTITGTVDAVIHLAAWGSVPRSFASPLKYALNNEAGFVSVMEAAREWGALKVIFASSSSVYGDNAEEIKREGQEGQPLSPYALSKKTNETFANIWGPRQDLITVGLRFFNVYGPGQRAKSFYSAVIPKFINEETPSVFGDGETTRDFTYVDDVCDAIMLALDCEESTTVNVGAGGKTSLNDLLDLLGKRDAAIYLSARKSDAPQSRACTVKAEKVLGFRARVSFKEGLEKARAYYEQRG